MDSRQLYIAWLRTQFPDLYVSALRKITGKNRSLGGLGDDLITTAFSPDVSSSLDNSMLSQDVVDAFGPSPMDTITVTAGGNVSSQYPALAPDSSGLLVDTSTFANPTSYLNPTTVPNTVPAVSAPAASAPASGGWWSALTTAVGQIGTTLLKTSAQNQLLSVNTARARAGLPPVNAMGQPVTAASLGPASAQILAMERAIAGTGGTGSIFLIGGLAIVALLLFSGKARR